MESMIEVARSAFAQIPPECRFRESDARLIQEFRDPLLALEPDVVKRFYDTVFAHPATSAVFVAGERGDRELTLAYWWRRTVGGPLDEQYFAWMAMVGLVHVARKVSNPMMLAMAGFVSALVAEKVAQLDIDRARGEALIEAFGRLTSTVGAIISFGYDRAYDRAVVAALDDIAGMPESLFQRLREQEVAAALTQARAEASRG